MRILDWTNVCSYAFKYYCVWEGRQQNNYTFALEHITLVIPRELDTIQHG